MRLGRELLAQLRADRSAWSLVRYLPQGEVGRNRRDPNAAARLQLTWALQEDFKPSDGPLLRFALEEEVKWREEDPWQGIGETLEILGALTARARDVHDVWVLARAKQANFDTHCGFDRHHAFAGGVAKTLAYVRSSDHPDRDAVLEILLDEQGEPQCDENDIQHWLARRSDQLPLEAAQRSRIWFERAMALGRLDIANALLDEWMLHGPRDVSTLRSHAYDLATLERWSEASAARKECFEFIHEPFEKASEACRIAGLERAAQNPEEAQRWLQFAAKLHADNIEWRQLGLGRTFVEECFRCALALGAHRGTEMFSLGDRFAKVTPGLPLVALEAAVLAAEALKSPSVSRYRRRRTREARRISRFT